ncbi:MAG TPA: hypothetical protein VHE78_17445 [Gemmatimonadaceae bacterium]|nr:hypothetical protein [Gemmatimonadaceae bacterium]
MVDVSVQGDRIIFEVEGWDKLWALKSKLEIPIEHVKGAKYDENAAKGWWHGVRLGGSDLPGVITAGTFYRKGRLVFYDTHKPENTIVVDLDHESYDQLILQVRDPEGAVKEINEAVARK